MLSLPDDMLNLAHIEPRSRIYGPGERFVIWVQGCELGCEGCWNEEMHTFEARNLVSVEDLSKMILAEEGIEGITILGGEPLHQSPSLVRLIEAIAPMSVMLYTGFESDEIQDASSRALVRASDIVITGRYVDSLRSTNLRWRGSSNQQIIVNNPRYTHITESLEDRNEIEVHIGNDGVIRIVGYPDDPFIEEALHG